MRIRALAPLLIGLVGCGSADEARELRLVGNGGYSPFGGGPGSSVQWIDFAVQKSATDPGDWGPLLLDIERHLPASYGNQYYDSNKLTHAHETTHGINSEIRNHHNKTGLKANGFYVLDNKAVVIPEPQMAKSKVAAYIPQALRGYRFPTYITGQTAWDDMPLYIFDEWVAYTNHAAVAVDLVNRSLWKQQAEDGVSGALEFTVYALGVARAIEVHDPQYFAGTTQFREFLAWNAKRAMNIFRAGREMKELPSSQQEQQYKTLQTGAEGAPLRDMLAKLYGYTFANEVLGLAPPPSQDAGPPAPQQPDASPIPPKPDSSPLPPPLKPDSGVAPPIEGGGPPPPPPPPPKKDSGLPPDVGSGSPPPPPPVVPPPAPPGPDMTPPSVKIDFPTEGSTLGPSFTALASVSDNVGVSRVELLIDGKPMAQRTVAPYNFPVTLANGKHVLHVVAYDAVNNRGQVAVSVTVTGGQDAPSPSQPPAPKGSFGAACTAPKDCKSNLCAEDVQAQLRYCTESCLLSGGASSCPATSACLPTLSGPYVCGPPGSAKLPTLPPPSEEPPSSSARPRGKDSLGCALVAARDLAGVAELLLVPAAIALAWLLGRRRRCSGRT